MRIGQNRENDPENNYFGGVDGNGFHIQTKTPATKIIITNLGAAHVNEDETQALGNNPV
jgi:hypothetical protein